MRPRPPQDLQLPFDRVTYRDGQLLASRDLQDDLKTDQRLRSLHTRYLHDTWGIALGFSVMASAGSAAVRVGPGYGLDATGQELLLSESVEIDVPDTASRVELVLVMNYQPNSAFQARPDLPAVCLSGALDPRVERPLFAWRTFETLKFGPDVPLAKVTAQKGALLASPDLEIRKNASRMIRPHISFGSVEFSPPLDTTIGEIQVDTSDSGFAGAPNYFAALSAADPAAPALFLAYVNTFSYIDRGTSASFFFNMPFSFLLRPLKTVRLHWFGIENVAGCEPVPRFTRFVSLAGFLRNFTFNQEIHR
jgi:hypothetical protein